MADFPQGVPDTVSPLSRTAQQTQPAKFSEEFDANHQGSSTLDGGQNENLRRADSTISHSHTLTPSRGGTLKKKRSLSRKGSLHRNRSGRDGHAGSVKSLGLDGQEDYNGENRSEMNDAFYTPIPTSGNPTEHLANRFQAWRKVLKDLITYFRDIQKTYEVRSKSLLTLSNVINNISTPPMFRAKGGIGDATQILQTYHKQAINEGNKAKTVLDEVIGQLTGLRSDLQQKIKEIKGLSGDFKNNVDKEVEATKRAVQEFQAALAGVDTDSSGSTGKGDPFIVKIGVDRQLQRQIDEENYLHRAFLNLESSGRELESIVVGEIQKAYSAYTGIIRKEADEAYEAIEQLQTGPLEMPKDYEWDSFVDNNERFVNPKLPVRRIENITYPGKDNPAASEVRAGMLERKSKYLKSYTPGWYVLSPTHLHEFKSPDRIILQAPVMSLHLADQKLGSHSNVGSSSHKFMLKGRQSGGIHRGHAWVFRAETYDTMLAWYEDIKNLTEKTGEERTAFVRQHARSISAGSNKAQSVSDDGTLDEDEADQVPYSTTASQIDQPLEREQAVQRPNPGGRFPSALTTDRNSQVPRSPSSPSSSGDRDIIAAGGPPGSDVLFEPSNDPLIKPVQSGHDETHQRSDLDGETSRPNTYNLTPQLQDHKNLPINQGPVPAAVSGTEYNTNPVEAEGVSSDGPGAVSYGFASAQQDFGKPAPKSFPPQPSRHDSNYGDWMGPAAGTAGGLAVGAGGVAAYESFQKNKYRQEDRNVEESEVETRKTTDKSQLSQEYFPSQTQAMLPTQQDPQPTESASVVDPTANSKPPVPPNAVWAAPVTASVMAPSQIQGSADATSADTKGAVDLLRKQGLSPVSEQPGLELSSADPSSDPSPRDPAEPIKALANRPPLESHASVTTISDLHVPGEYPKAKPDMELA